MKNYLLRNCTFATMLLALDANLSYSSFEDIRKECSWMNGSWVK